MKMNNEIELINDSRKQSRYKNCVFIGDNAGIDIISGEGIIIIGDDIRSLDKSQSNVLFIGDKIAIGTSINGVLFNLKEVLTTLYKK